MERANERHWDRIDRIALAGSVGAHALLLGLLWIGLMGRESPLPQSKPMTVEILAETDLESTSPDPSSEAPAAFQAPENVPIDDAPAAEPLAQPEPVTLPEPEPAPPLPPVKPVAPPPRPVQKVAPKPPVERTVERELKKAVVKPAPKAVPKATPKTTPKAQPRPAPAKTTAKAGTGSGRGTAARPSGDLASIVSGIGKSKSNSSSTGAPGAKSAAQIRQSITTSIKSQVEGPWNRCRVTGIDVDALTTIVKFRLDRDGSLAGFSSVNTTGVNDSNRTQQARHQECARKAIQQASPFTGLAPEHYSYWQNYEFKFQKR